MKCRFLQMFLPASLLALLVSVPALAGDVGGEVYSNPDVITLRLEWGSSFENSQEINKAGDGQYSFGVNLRNNTKYRVRVPSAPAGWGCRGKQADSYLNNSAATDTHVYCATASSDGVRLASWNLEWFDTGDDPAKKRAIAEVIQQFDFDILILNEVLDGAVMDELIQSYLGGAPLWDYRITEAGCSLRQVTLWKTDKVTFLDGYELNCANSNCYIDENSATWDDCGGRRPYVATFGINGTSTEFSTSTIHFKAKTTTSDCQLRKEQVDTFVQWADWAGMGSQHFVALGDFNDTLPGTGNCTSIDTLSAMELHPSFWFATAQPDYHYWHMMGNGLVTYDTTSFQETIDHIWVSDSLFQLLDADVDTFRNLANTVQANMYFADWDEPDHNPPFVVIGTGTGSGGDDTTAPTVSITSPANGATVSGTLTVAADASDDTGVSQVDFYLDGALEASDVSSPYEWSWDTTTSADGSHSLGATASDDAGNVGSASTITVTVDNSGTTGGITLSASGYKVQGTQHADLFWAGATATNVDVYRDGAVIATTTNDGTYTDNIGKKGGGSYVYQVCEAGTANCSNEATVTF